MSDALALIVSRLPDARQNGSGHKARCPGHDDQHASLSISQGDKGVVLYCHAGCPPESVVEALGLTMADLFDRKNGHAERPEKLGKLVATYDYRSSTEELLYQAVRYLPKDFRQRRPDGKGGWIWNLTGVKRVLYRLPELIAASPQRTVYIAEGEKDADSLVKLGLLAACNVGGAGKWRDAYSVLLEGRHVVVLPHNDKPGREHGQQVARSAHGIAASLKVLDLPGLADHGDVSDWITAGGNRDQLKLLVEAATEWAPPSPLEGTPAAESSVRRPCTQLGNAERLVDQHGADIRYCKPWGEWMYCDGRRWAMNATGHVNTLAAGMVRGIYQEAADADSKEERRELSAWARRCESEAQINAAVSLARWMVPTLPGRFDADPWLLNVRNGTINLRTETIREHRRADYVTKLIDLNYDPGAECPRWLAFLERVLPDPSVRDFVHRAAGYSSTGSARERKLLIPYGTGKNGKGVFLQTLKSILGEYAVRAPSETFMVKHPGAIPNDIAQLRGARFVFTSETNEGQRLAEATIKDLTGGEEISARFMRGEFFTFLPTFTPWLATNHRPVIRGSDPAIWDRIGLIPFSVRIPDDEQDPDLLEKLKAEYPGILTWIVRGAAEWYRHGLGTPAAVREATGSYQAEMDVLGTFVSERCINESDPETGWVLAAALYEAYTEWCEESGERPMPKRTLGLRLAERGYRPSRVGRARARGWDGLRLMADGDVETEPDAAMTADATRPADAMDAISGMTGSRVLHKGLIPEIASIASAAVIASADADTHTRSDAETFTNVHHVHQDGEPSNPDQTQRRCACGKLTKDAERERCFGCRVANREIVNEKGWVYTEREQWEDPHPTLAMPLETPPDPQVKPRSCPDCGETLAPDRNYNCLQCFEKRFPE